MESRWRRTQLVSIAGSGGGYPGTTGDMAALACVRGSDSLVARVLVRPRPVSPRGLRAGEPRCRVIQRPAEPFDQQIDLFG